jgi:hypothetical protein
MDNPPRKLGAAPLWGKGDSAVLTKWAWYFWAHSFHTTSIFLPVVPPPVELVVFNYYPS